jgi:serine/threonine-protein kinase
VTIAGNWRTDEVIGSGAMGTIYRATQVSLGKTVVIKLLHKHLSGDPTLKKRFHREAKAASLLNHPNCIQVIDFGQQDDGAFYIAMEHVDGVDLAELIYEQFPLDPVRTIRILKQVCAALDEAHANGVLHRDLKPENVMVSERRNQPDFVKVLDFGIAKLQEGSGEGGASTFQTVAGVVCGTPEYMSPEQARGEKLDGRTDLYALGIVLYQMLTNELPFEADSALGVVTKHLSEKPKPPRQHHPAVPPSLEALCLQLLEKDRNRRPQTALDVTAELNRIERELEAQARETMVAGRPSDRTVVELRPVQMAEFEKARQEYEDRRSPVARPISQESKTSANPATERPRADAKLDGPDRATTVPEMDEHPVPAGGSAVKWLVGGLVTVALALVVWLIVKVAGY